MIRIRKLGYVIAGALASLQASVAEGDPVYQPILDAFDITPATGAVVAAGVAVIGLYVARGSIMSLINMIRGALR